MRAFKRNEKACTTLEINYRVIGPSECRKSSLQHPTGRFKVCSKTEGTAYRFLWLIARKYEHQQLTINMSLKNSAYVLNVWCELTFIFK